MKLPAAAAVLLLAQPTAQARTVCAFLDGVGAALPFGWGWGGVLRLGTWLGCLEAGAGSELPPEAVCMLYASGEAPPDATAPPVRGVPPGAAARYSAPAGGNFSCLDGSGELPLALVNDDFCDCADGSDEPGTAACAGQPGRCFYCRNEAFRPRFVYASRVGDGICDCCDGSDEAGASTILCPNTCESAGAAARAEQQRRKEAVREGLRRREAMQTNASSGVEAWRTEVQSIQKKLPELEAAQKAAKARKEAAQAREKEERQAAEAQRKAAEEVAATASEPGAPEAAGTEEEAAEAAARPESPEGGAAKEKVAGGSPPAGTQEKPQVSEYAKWALDQKAQEPGGGQAAAAEPGRAVAAAGSPAVAEQSEAAKELEAAKAELSSADAALREAKRRQGDLEGWLKLDLGESRRWFSLVGTYAEKSTGEYTYRICFFDTAKQDHIKLGTFSGWDPKAPLVMKFTDGSQCHAGPKRSLEVTFVCGAEEGEVLAVAEPSRCAYEARVGHPSACTEEDLRVLDIPLEAAGATLPHEEL